MPVRCGSEFQLPVGLPKIALKMVLQQRGRHQAPGKLCAWRHVVDAKFLRRRRDSDRRRNSIDGRVPPFCILDPEDPVMLNLSFNLFFLEATWELSFSGDPYSHFFLLAPCLLEWRRVTSASSKNSTPQPVA